MADAPVRPGARLAIVISHPIQYFSPWFRHIAATSGIDLKVFYLWDSGVALRYDRQFGQAIRWDIPLLEGYEYVFVPNRSHDPGTHHFGGLDNPQLVSALIDWKPDAILLFGYLFHSHFRVMFSRRLTGVPLLLRGDSHDLFRPPGWRSNLARRARSLLFKRFASFLAVGKANAEYFRHCGVPREHIHFVPHCVDNQRFQDAAPQAALDAAAWRAELGIAANAYVILFAGKFEPKKRPLDLLAAFGIAQEELRRIGGPAPALLFVGAGALERELRAASAKRIGKTFFFVPFQNQSRMPTVYAMGDLLVLPSFGVGETWGLAVNEAMNLAKPVIVSTHVGCASDLVLHGQTGWVFKAGDIDALAATIVQALLLGREHRAQMGLAAREQVGRYSYTAATAGLSTALSAVMPKTAEHVADLNENSHA